MIIFFIFVLLAVVVAGFMTVLSFARLAEVEEKLDNMELPDQFSKDILAIKHAVNAMQDELVAIERQVDELNRNAVLK